jgi:crossover junction endodeoxyribonuclease RuvC
MSKVRILGIDPGTAIVGYGVLDCPDRNSFQAVASGVIRTSNQFCMGERLKMIRGDLLDLIIEYRPDVLALEALFFFKNAKTVIPVAQARGVILEAAANANVPVFEYTPMQVKQTVAGHGRADKKTVQMALARMLNHEDIIKPDDAADALALAICHARMSIVQLIKTSASV